MGNDFTNENLDKNEQNESTKRQVNYDVDKELQQLWFFWFFLNDRKSCSDFGGQSNGEHLVVENNSKLEFNEKDADIIYWME